MNSDDLCKPSKAANAHSADSMTIAERELGAFFNAVAQLFGREQADRSAEDWLRLLAEMNALPSSRRGWRSITIRALAELGQRVGAGAARLTANLTNA